MKILKNIYNNIILRLYHLLYNNRCGSLILTISYIFLLRGTNIAYCGWFDIYWSFPLEKDVAAQSWGEQSESSQEIMKKQWEFLEDWRKRNEQLKKTLSIYSSRTYDGMVRDIFYQEDIKYLQTLDNLTPKGKAASILKRLYNPILDTLRSQKVTDFEEIKFVVFTALVQDCTFTLWVQDYSGKELLSDHPNTIQQSMIAINKAFILEGNGEEQKDVAAHMIIIMEKCSAANLLDLNILDSLNDQKNYNARYDQCRYGR